MLISFYTYWTIKGWKWSDLKDGGKILGGYFVIMHSQNIHEVGSCSLEGICMNIMKLMSRRWSVPVTIRGSPAAFSESWANGNQAVKMTLSCGRRRKQEDVLTASRWGGFLLSFLLLWLALLSNTGKSSQKTSQLSLSLFLPIISRLTPQGMFRSGLKQPEEKMIPLCSSIACWWHLWIRFWLLCREKPFMTGKLNRNISGS